MALAKAGDRVSFNFVGTLADGNVFDTTYEKAGCEDDDCCEDEECGCGPEPGPMELTLGSDEFFPAVEEALVGMSVGEKKTITLEALDACGEYDEEALFSLPRSQFPDDVKPVEGDDIELVGDDGESMIVSVVEVNDGEVMLDANHPLAGEALTFELELVAIL